MKKAQSFGGDWTEDKLKRINKYLKAYTKIFAANQKAQFLTTIYVDAFASTGDRASEPKNNGSGPNTSDWPQLNCLMQATLIRWPDGKIAL